LRRIAVARVEEREREIAPQEASELKAKKLRSLTSKKFAFANRTREKLRTRN
jgi:hypothetical protein